MAPRYDDDWIATMMDLEKRVGTKSPEKLLADSGLKGGQVVVDLGCGPGLFSIAAATVVGPSGTVYSVDTEQKMLDIVDRRAADLGLANVMSVVSAGDRLPLEDDVADFAIAGLMVHYRDGFEARVDLVRDIARVTRPGGRVLIIEWTNQPGEVSPHRISQDDAIGILREAGLSPGEPEPLALAIISNSDGS